MMDKEYIQSQNINKHKEVANKLLEKGFAYNAIVQKKKLKNKKIKQKKLKCLLFIIENGEMLKILNYS